MNQCENNKLKRKPVNLNVAYAETVSLADFLRAITCTVQKHKNLYKGQKKKYKFDITGKRETGALYIQLYIFFIQ